MASGRGSGGRAKQPTQPHDGCRQRPSGDGRPRARCTIVESGELMDRAARRSRHASSVSLYECMQVVTSLVNEHAFLALLCQAGLLRTLTPRVLLIDLVDPSRRSPGCLAAPTQPRPPLPCEQRVVAAPLAGRTRPRATAHAQLTLSPANPPKRAIRLIQHRAL